jgi:hypothetical protein
MNEDKIEPPRMRSIEQEKAEWLADRVNAFWRNLGFEVKAEAYPAFKFEVSAGRNTVVWGVKSSLVGAMPPNSDNPVDRRRIKVKYDALI